MKSKAIVFREANKPQVEEIEVPALKDDEVMVDIEYSGVSIGTESSIFSGKRTQNGTFPLVSGYMATGAIIEKGRNSGILKKGDRVAVVGARLDCDVNSVWGAHNSIQVISAANAIPVPEKAPMKDAAMFIMSNVGLNAVSMAEVNEQETVLISGQGLIGQMFGQWSRARGAKVITIEPDPQRAVLSKKYVTQYVLNPFKDDIAKSISELTSGKGPDVVVEATASAKLISESTKLLRPHSKMVFLSWYPEEISINFSHFHNNYVRALFPMGSGNTKTTEATLNGIAMNTITFGENITDVYSFDKAVDGFKRLIEGDRSVMGMVIDWRKA